MEQVNRQTWLEFEEQAEEKQVILFGAGNYARKYFQKYCGKLRLAGVIDNNPQKQGLRLAQCFMEVYAPPESDLSISSVSILEWYSDDNAIVLIASKNHYEDMLAQVHEYGITNCYVIVRMEENEKQEAEKMPILEPEQQKRQFVAECCKRYDISPKKVFFYTYGKYTEHGKYITEALLKIRSDLEIVWMLSNLTTDVPDGVRKVYAGNWRQHIYELETARIWILSLAVPDFIEKRNGQVYIQTKHWASITLKKFYLDAVKSFASVPEKLENWERDGRLMDYVITGSEFDTASCRSGFGFKGEALQFGSPRSDALFHEVENRKKVYDYYHIKKDIKTLLYAPTYRFDKKKGNSFHAARLIELDFARVKRALEKRFGGEWYILFRLHPSVADAFRDVERPDYVVNVSEYEDSEELVAAGDITISDFSSIMFEHAFVKKPVFLFATDRREYLQNEYELLLDYDSLPFPIAESNDELVRKIEEFDCQKYECAVTDFLERYGIHEDGHASDRSAAFISNLIGGDR